MELGFFKRGGAGTDEKSSVRIDYDVLTATLQAFQSTSATARAQALAPEPGPADRIANEPLVELLTGGPDWREAIDRQGGSFNSACARRGRERD